MTIELGSGAPDMTGRPQRRGDEEGQAGMDLIRLLALSPSHDWQNTASEAFLADRSAASLSWLRQRCGCTDGDHMSMRCSSYSATNPVSAFSDCGDVSAVKWSPGRHTSVGNRYERDPAAILRAATN
jgi:hypothetical protein